MAKKYVTKADLRAALVTLLGALDRQCLDVNGKQFGYSDNVERARRYAETLLESPVRGNPVAVDDVMKEVLGSSPRKQLEAAS